MQFSSLRFGHFCDFHLKVCFYASGSSWFQNLVIFVPDSQTLKDKSRNKLPNLRDKNDKILKSRGPRCVKQTSG
ncbi:hypothetical protein Hanom_Chr10g00945771 [Helianthus anomalus]